MSESCQSLFLWMRRCRAEGTLAELCIVGELFDVHTKVVFVVTAR